MAILARRPIILATRMITGIFSLCQARHPGCHPGGVRSYGNCTIPGIILAHPVTEHRMFLHRMVWAEGPGPGPRAEGPRQCNGPGGPDLGPKTGA